MGWHPQPKPDPEHTPTEGDGYIEPIHGCVVRVMKVTDDRVHYAKSNGWAASMDREEFARRCRRFVKS